MPSSVMERIWSWRTVSQAVPAATDQIAIDANGIDERHHRGVLDHADSAPLEVKDLEAQKFGEEQELFRHRVPESIDLELLRILL